MTNPDEAPVPTEAIIDIEPTETESTEAESTDIPDKPATIYIQQPGYYRQRVHPKYPNRIYRTYGRRPGYYNKHPGVYYHRD